MGNRTDQIWVRRQRQRKTNCDKVTGVINWTILIELCHYAEKVEFGSVSWFRQWCLHAFLMSTWSAIKLLSWNFSSQRNWISPLLLHAVSYKPGRMSLYLTQQSGCFWSSSLQGRYCASKHTCRATDIVGLATEPQIDGRPLYNVDNCVWLRL